MPAPTFVAMSDGRVLCTEKHRPKRGGRAMDAAEVDGLLALYPDLAGGFLCEECNADDLGLLAIR